MIIFLYPDYINVNKRNEKNYFYSYNNFIITNQYQLPGRKNGSKNPIWYLTFNR